MKTPIMKIYLSVFAFMLGGILYAQPKNVQNAAMDYNSYEKALMNNNTKGAKSAIMKAKTSIDEAAANPTTAQDLKMLFYKGKIYMGIAALAAMMADDEELKPFANEETLQTGMDAWKLCYESDTKSKFRDDIKLQITMIAAQSVNMGGKMYADQKYQEAFDLFSSSVKLYDIIGKNDKDYGAIAFNAGLSAERLEKYEDAHNYYVIAENSGFEPASSASKAANALFNAGKKDEAMKFAVASSEKYPGDGGLIVTMADLALKTGQDELAIKSLNQAIQKDPKNGVYHWAVGTVYQRLNREEEALASFEKAVQLSPNDDRPYYSLGTYYFNKAVDLMEQANKLKLGDARFDELEAKAVEEFKKAAPYLEKVVEIKGDAGNKELLNNLFTINRKIGNTTKALDFKKRAEALN